MENLQGNRLPIATPMISFNVQTPIIVKPDVDSQMFTATGNSNVVGNIDNGFVRCTGPYAQQRFSAFYSSLKIPSQSEAWNEWSKLVKDLHCSSKDELEIWIVYSAFHFLSRLRQQDPKSTSAYLQLSLKELCEAVPIKLMDYIRSIGSIEIVLYQKRLEFSLALERKFCTSLALFQKYAQLYPQVFVDGNIPYKISYRLVWMLYLVATSLKIGQTNNITENYNLLLCAFAYTVSLVDASDCQPPFNTASRVATDIGAFVIEELSKDLDVCYSRCMKLYKNAWVPFRDFLQQLCKQSRTDLLQYLQSKYSDCFQIVYDIDETLFLKRDPFVQCSSSTSRNIGKGLSTCRVQALDMLLSQLPPIPSDGLQKYLEASPKFSERKLVSQISTYRTLFMASIQAYNYEVFSELSDEIFDKSVRLYMAKLESILISEEAKSKTKDFSALFNKDDFHKALLAVCIEAVVHGDVLLAFRMEVSKFPHVMTMMDVSAYNTHRVIETFLLHAPFLDEPVVQHLLKLEVSIVKVLAWKEEFVHKILSAAKLEGIAKNIQSFMQELPIQECGVHYQSMYFMLRVKRVMQCRLLSFCEALMLDDSQYMNTWPCLEYAMFCKPDIPYKRDLDQLMMCAVYAIGKVIGQELQFKNIVSKYKELKLGEDEIYKKTMITPEHFDTIITFYNKIFMPALKEFVLKFGSQIKDRKKENIVLSNFLQKDRAARSQLYAADRNEIYFPSLKPFNIDKVPGLKC